MARPIQKRADIETAVVEVVGRKGLHATTIQDIAVAADVSPGLLYRYWKNRDEVAEEVYRRLYTELVMDLVQRGGRESDPWRQLCLVIAGFLDYADRNPVELRFLLLAQHDLGRSVSPEVGIRGHLETMLERALSSRRPRADVPIALSVQLALGIVLQPVVGVLYGDLAGPPSQYAGQIQAALARVLEIDTATPCAEAEVGHVSK